MAVSIRRLVKRRVYERTNQMPTTLLNDDGTASMATLLMSSHHAFRRDVACFAKVLATVTSADTTRITALAEEWTRFRGALHGHHTIEDTSMFPSMREQHPEIAATIDELDGHHRAIEPLLQRGDAVFAALARELPAAREVIGALGDLLATHLDLEERTITPHLRAAKTFPAPPDDSALAMYADGFAWSTAGIAKPVCDQIFAMLPAGLVTRLPTAREAFDARCKQVWGFVHTGASTTSVPSA
jgi:hemerythrin-like domain-containing protein